MQQSPRERPLPGAKQTYLGQPRVGRRVYGKDCFPFFNREPDVKLSVRRCRVQGSFRGRDCPPPALDLDRRRRAVLRAPDGKEPRLGSLPHHRPFTAGWTIRRHPATSSPVVLVVLRLVLGPWRAQGWMCCQGQEAPPRSPRQETASSDFGTVYPPCIRPRRTIAATCHGMRPPRPG